jgi:hypothetical protein
VTGKDQLDSIEAAGDFQSASRISVAAMGLMQCLR